MSRIRPVTVINIQSTLRTAPDLCKNVSLKCYLVATVIHVQSVRIQTCVLIHTCSSEYRDAGRANEIKTIGTAVNAACHFGYACHTLSSSALDVVRSHSSPSLDDEHASREVA